MQSPDDVRVRGSLMLAFAQACVNLDFFVDADVMRRVRGHAPEGWYPLTDFLDMMAVVAGAYPSPAPVLEQIGVEMTRSWYSAGPGRSVVHRSVDFLLHQTGSEGYRSIVGGDPAQLGDFVLSELDEVAGRAVVTSTTPFSKDMERGILHGGMSLLDDLVYVDVDNSADPNIFVIEFH